MSHGRKLRGSGRHEGWAAVEERTSWGTHASQPQPAALAERCGNDCLGLDSLGHISFYILCIWLLLTTCQMFT